jgi:hypothetical protein
MARGKDTGDHPGRKVGRDTFSGAPVTPTSRSEMGGFEGPRCNNCGSYNTEESSAGGHDCYDCGHTSNPPRPSEGSPGPEGLQSMFGMG